jgi:hypothetical protein
MEGAMAESMTGGCIEDRMDKAATRHQGLPPATRNDSANQGETGDRNITCGHYA